MAAGVAISKEDIILVTGAVFVSIFVVFAADQIRLLVSVRRELDGSERNRCPGISVPHLLRPDQWIDVPDVVYTALSKNGGAEYKVQGECDDQGVC